jgi:pimeloyl-ACP methyl ester carboxylesterase
MGTEKTACSQTGRDLLYFPTGHERHDNWLQRRAERMRVTLTRTLRSATAALVTVMTNNSAVMAASLEQDITFQGSGGVAIVGTLVLPEPTNSDRPAPAVLLIQGSGPTDRDGNQPPNFQAGLLRQLADILAGAGIASLRYDKRGMHENQHTLPKHQDELSDFFSWSAFVYDAHAAFAFLTTYPGIASDRVGVFGHSEGGLLVLDFANQYRPQPKLLILASTPGRPLGEVIHDQLSALLEQQRATAEQRQFFLNADQRIRSEILATGKVPPDVPPGIAALYPSYLGLFLKSELALNPAALVANIEGPILVINGTADTQVSAAQDAARFSSALANRKDGSEVFTPPAVSHNLKTVTGPNDQGITGALDGSARDTILRWLTSKL